MLGHMRRREFIGLVGAAAAWPVAARAQQAGMPVVGFLNAAALPAYDRPYAAFLKGLGETGHVQGRNVLIETRWAEGQYNRLSGFIAEFVQRKVKVIAATSTPAAVAAKTASTSIPTVFTTSGDPVQLHLVSSLSRPDGNMTGASQLNVEVAPKRLELMHELLPAATTMALLINPKSPVAETVLRELETAANALGLKLHVVRASDERDLGTVFETLSHLKAEALVIGTDTFFNNESEEIARLAVRYRIPTIYQYPEFTTAGGLVSYGGNLTESYRLAGGYVGRILKGEPPSNLPVQQVTKVDLILNLKTAKALGLDIPLPLVNRADEVIE
jgi:putative ABC transport system substrate-binding protein